MSLPTPPWARVVLSVFVVVHVLAGAANVSRETGPGKALRVWTKPWEKVLAVHQTWPMFAVPPTSTNWLVARGLPRGGGEMVPLDVLPGEPPMDGVAWVYVRAGKLERNAVAKKRDYLRASFTRELCRRHPDIAEVHYFRASRRTPRPRFGEPFKPRPDWPVRHSELGSWRCGR